MKKILFPVLFSIVVLLVTGLFAFSSTSAEDQKIVHIMQSFDVVAGQFYQRAEQDFTPTGDKFLYLSDETTNTHYYLTMIVDGRGTITMVNASIQIELANDVCEINDEGIRLSYEEKGYVYNKDRRLIFRNENCRIEKMEPIEGVWDAVLNKFFDSI
jgi:hypothetical protein